MRNSYYKLKDGSWGVKVAGEVNPGDQVTVYTQAGTEKHETIDRVVYTGPSKFDDGATMSLCSIAKSGKGQSAGGPTNSREVCPACKRPF